MGKSYPNEIRRILTLPGGDVGKECRALALAIAVEAKRQAELTFGKHPMDQPRTGRYAQSYQVKVLPGTNQFTVINPRKQAAAMEKGARPHIIRARRKTKLQFRDRSGRWRYVEFVNHPGSAAHNTLTTAMRVAIVRRYGTYRSS